MTDSKTCPECGGEMRQWEEWAGQKRLVRSWWRCANPKCGHEGKVT